MELSGIIHRWYELWEKGDFSALPLHDAFEHHSPFGMIAPKERYLSLVAENKDKFLGYTFKIHDKIIGDNSACVRYTARQGKELEIEVSEWFYFENGLIRKIHSYYHIGEIREDRKLDD